MEVIACYLLMLQKYVNLKQKSLKRKVMHCVEVIFQKILHLIIWKKHDWEEL